MKWPVVLLASLMLAVACDGESAKVADPTRPPGAPTSIDDLLRFDHSVEVQLVPDFVLTDEDHATPNFIFWRTFEGAVRVDAVFEAAAGGPPHGYFVFNDQPGSFLSEDALSCDWYVNDQDLYWASCGEGTSGGLATTWVEGFTNGRIVKDLPSRQIAGARAACYLVAPSEVARYSLFISRGLELDDAEVCVDLTAGVPLRLGAEGYGYTAAEVTAGDPLTPSLPPGEFEPLAESGSLDLPGNIAP